jgi:hypothetical protein
MSGVALDIGVQHVLEHQFHLPRHPSERCAGAVHGRVVHDRLGPLGDVLGVIADPLEVGGDAEDRQDTRRSLGDRLTLRDDARGLLVDLLVQRVDGGVALADAFRQVGVAGLQCLGRFRDRVLDQPAHAHDVGLDRFEVAVEGGDDMFRRSHCFLS